MHREPFVAAPPNRREVRKRATCTALLPYEQRLNSCVRDVSSGRDVGAETIWSRRVPHSGSTSPSRRARPRLQDLAASSRREATKQSRVAVSSRRALRDFGEGTRRRRRGRLPSVGGKIGRRGGPGGVGQVTSRKNKEGAAPPPPGGPRCPVPNDRRAPTVARLDSTQAAAPSGHLDARVFWLDRVASRAPATDLGEA